MSSVVYACIHIKPYSWDMDQDMKNGKTFTAAVKQPPGAGAGAGNPPGAGAGAVGPPGAGAGAAGEKQVADCTKYFTVDEEHKKDKYKGLGGGLQRCDGTTIIYKNSTCYRRQCRGTVRTEDRNVSKLTVDEITATLAAVGIELGREDADDIADFRTYYVCFRHTNSRNNQILSKIPYPYIQQVATEDKGILIDELDGIQSMIVDFTLDNVGGGDDFDTLLGNLKNRMALIIDHIRASSDTSTEEGKEELRATLIRIKDPLKRKFDYVNNNGAGLQEVWKKRKIQLDEIMELSAKSLGSDDYDL